MLVTAIHFLFLTTHNQSAQSFSPLRIIPKQKNKKKGITQLKWPKLAHISRLHPEQEACGEADMAA